MNILSQLFRQAQKKASNRVHRRRWLRSTQNVLAIGILMGTGLSAPVQAASPECPLGVSLQIVAHQDDDILFMNPKVQQDIQTGRCVVTAFITAGDANEGTAYWQSRESGAKAAYATMAGVSNTWTVSSGQFGGHTLALSTLNGRPSVKLLFMRLADGGVGGGGFSNDNNESLQKLWSGSISSMHPLDNAASYSRSALIATLTGIMRTFQPDLIRGQDYNGSFGDGDHSDHHAAAYFTLEAHRAYFTAHTLEGLRGYNASSLPANVAGSDKTAKETTFLAYAAFDHNVCQTLTACQSAPFSSWISHQYTSGSEIGGSGNITRLGTITASSQNSASNQQASKIADGYVNGFLAGFQQDYTREWATNGGKAGSWVNVAWASQHTLNKIVLYDRPNSDDQVTGGTLTFSDGSMISTGSLPGDGSPQVITFAPKNVTSLRFTATSVSATTKNIGLAELQAYEQNVAPLATVTASSQNTASSQGANKAVDGFAVGWPVDYTHEWATNGGKTGSWLTLAWDEPQTLSRVVLFDRPNSDDQITSGVLRFSDGSTVAVPSLPNDGSPLTLTFSPRTATSLRLDITGVKSTTLNIGLAEIQAS